MNSEKHSKEMRGQTKVVLGGTAFILGLTVGVGLYKTFSPFENAVNSVARAIGLNVGETPPVPPTFDNSKDEGVMGPDNMTILSQEEIDKQFPTAFAKLNDGKNTLELLSPLQIETSSDPNAQIAFVKSFHGSSLAESEEYKGKGIYDQINYKNVPGGTTIVAPIDGWLVNNKSSQSIPPNGSDTPGVSIQFVSLDGNQYRLVIGGSTTKDFEDGSLSRSTGYVFKSLVKAPDFTPEDNQKVIGTYGIAVKKGDRILELIQTRDNKPIEEVAVAIIVARKGTLGEPFSINNPPIPTNLDLFVTPDGKLATKSSA